MVKGKGQVHWFIFSLHKSIQLLKRFLQLTCPGTCVENQLAIYARVYFWTLYSVPYIYLDANCLDYCSFIISLESGSVFVTYRCITNYHKFGGLKQYTFIISQLPWVKDPGMS